MQKKKLKSILLLVNSEDNHEDLIKILKDTGVYLNIPKKIITSLLPLNYMEGKNKLLIYEHNYGIIKKQIANLKCVKPSKLEEFYDKWSIDNQIANIKHINPIQLEKKPMGFIFPDKKYIRLCEGYEPQEIFNMIKEEYKIIKNKHHLS